MEKVHLNSEYVQREILENSMLLNSPKLVN
jgi:hypothetical protein